MITLNTEKGIVKIQSWEEIIERPGYVSDLDSKKEKLKEIIGNYSFKEKVRCGLSNCHTPHNNGYLVVTESGHETNIGKDCGGKYFGVDFQNQRKLFDNLVQDTNNRERLWSLNFQLDDILQKIEDIDNKAFGAKWAYSKVKDFNRILPSMVKDKLYRMIKERNADVSVDFEMSEREIKDMEAIQNIKLPRPQYRSEVVTRLDGLAALYPENDIRELLVNHLKRELAAFKDLDIENLNSTDLKRWAKWSSTVEDSFEQIDISLNAHRSLLTKNNIRKLSYFIEKEEDKKSFEKALEDHFK